MGARVQQASRNSGGRVAPRAECDGGRDRQYRAAELGDRGLVQIPISGRPNASSYRDAMWRNGKGTDSIPRRPTKRLVISLRSNCSIYKVVKHSCAKESICLR